MDVVPGEWTTFVFLFAVSLLLVAAYLALYTWATVHNEFALIRQNVPAAAVSLGLSLVGFTLPVAAIVLRAQTIVDCLIWGLVAMAVQIGAYWLVRLVLPDLSGRIAGGEMAAAFFLGAASLSAGILNAALMGY